MKVISFFAGAVLALTGVAAMLPVSQASAGHILVDQINPFANKIGPGGNDWDTAFTNALASQPGGYAIGSIANAADVAGASAILVVYRNPFGGPITLSAPEIANLSDFLGKGGRVALIGEGDFFAAWNNSIVNFANAYAGGASNLTVGPMFNGNTSAVVANDLTAGVTTFNLQGGGITPTAGSSGTALFDKNFATLWRNNLVTILDAQVFRNLAPANAGDAIFRENVADWLGASVVTPLPGALSMMVGGLGVIGFLASRRKRKNAAA